ncbi:hypothetical protein TanjilG_18286 [Lupinus angustifolius]|uniref:EF-hand domain-containing protein n=1 Tax=Lupinus angustifolius TaxID=3871 RepID=A0A1J7GCR0_LUPAN|nr:hypothetical protein TanjilG_18286 [Lupinus angustifolius]
MSRKMRSDTQFERVLRYFDEDGDGKVSPSELRHKLSMMGGELLLKEAEMAIEALDSDGDGFLSLEDLIVLMESGGEEENLEDLIVLMESGGEGEKLENLRDAFEMYDTGRCGFITSKSLKNMLKRMGESKSIDECKVMINQFDLNEDGMLSFEEFRIMMH